MLFCGHLASSMCKLFSSLVYACFMLGQGRLEYKPNMKKHIGVFPPLWCSCCCIKHAYTNTQCMLEVIQCLEYNQTYSQPSSRATFKAGYVHGGVIVVVRALTGGLTRVTKIRPQSRNATASLCALCLMGQPCSCFSKALG